MSDENFIPGIYNYCDRWCEKCAFTSRCLNYKNLKDAGLLEDVDLNNPRFWESLAAVFSDTVHLLNETSNKYKIDLNNPEIEKNAIKSKLIESKNHSLVVLANDYSSILETFFEKWENQILSILDTITDEEKTGSIVDSIDVARWYQHFIPAKINRAVDSKLNLTLSHSEIEEINDALGSAKVALVSIERSMSALAMLYTDLPLLLDDIIPILSYLEILNKKVRNYFPKAYQYIRPGLDEKI
jgi:hypothetical protein